MKKVKMRRLLHIVLFLALAICQVPGTMVVGQCEMACCKPKISSQKQILEKDSCCCALTVIHKHVANDAASPVPITGDFEILAIASPIEFATSEAVLVNRAPIPHAQGPPGGGIAPLPPSRAPPVS